MVYCLLCVKRGQVTLCHAALTRRSADAHAIYLLNLLLAFLQPKFDPSLEADLVADNIEEGGEELPTTRQDATDEEFRPFVRRLPEWDFWSVQVSCDHNLTLYSPLHSKHTGSPPLRPPCSHYSAQPP